jgi:hypothetical protein
MLPINNLDGDDVAIIRIPEGIPGSDSVLKRISLRERLLISILFSLIINLGRAKIGFRRHWPKPHF